MITRVFTLDDLRVFGDTIWTEPVTLVMYPSMPFVRLQIKHALRVAGYPYYIVLGAAFVAV